jgi:hypothetical protein
MQTIALIDLKFRRLPASLRECLDATGLWYSVKMNAVCKSMLPLIACCLPSTLAVWQDFFVAI